MGSMEREERRKRGVEVEISVGRVAWRIVVGRREGEIV